MAKYFMHRIQEDNGTITKGIEVHDTLDAAVLSYYGRMKTAYNNPQNPDMTFVSCKVCDEGGNAIVPYKMAWLKDEAGRENKFFLHSIRKDGDSYTKNIDAYDTMDGAMIAFASAMEYGYSNPKFPNVSMVSCEITDLLSGGRTLHKDSWTAPAQTAEE